MDGIKCDLNVRIIAIAISQHALKLTMSNELDDYIISWERMNEFIHSGRAAIEFSLLLEIINSKQLDGAHENEMASLLDLLRTYNLKMARYEKKDVATAANDNFYNILDGD